MQTLFALIFEIVVGAFLGGKSRQGSPRRLLSTHEVGVALTFGGVIAGIVAVATYIVDTPQVLSILPENIEIWVAFIAGVIAKAAQLAGKDTTK